MFAREIFPLKAQESGAALWAGIGLNPGSLTIAWSEAPVQRIAGMLVLWWYFYAHSLNSPRAFLEKVVGPQSNKEFPQAKEFHKSLESMARLSDPDMPEKQQAKWAEDRLKALLALARASESASADGMEEEELYGGRHGGFGSRFAFPRKGIRGGGHVRRHINYF